MRVTERRVGVIGVLTIAAVTGLGAQTLPYKLVENWGALPAGEAWGEVTGVEIDRTGTIIAVRRSEPPVVELDASGKVLKTWGQGMFVWPHGFRIDRDGNLWVTDGRAEGGKGQQVFKLARDGRVLLTLGTKGVGGETPSTFDGPCDVAIGENGAIFVADGHRNNRVVKFSKDGTFIKAWGSKGEGPGQFQTPHAIAIDSRGRLFVADRGNRRIQILRPGRQVPGRVGAVRPPQRDSHYPRRHDVRSGHPGQARRGRRQRPRWFGARRHRGHASGERGRRSRRRGVRRETTTGRTLRKFVNASSGAWFGVPLPAGLGNPHRPILDVSALKPAAAAVPPGEEGYRELAGAAIRGHLEAIIGFSKADRARGEKAWGRITGFRAADETHAWVLQQFQAAGQIWRFQPPRFACTVDRSSMEPTLGDPLPRTFGRVSLRRLVPADHPTFQAYRHDASVGQYQDWAPLSDGDASQFIADMSHVALFPRGQWVQLAIADRRTNELIGDLGICVAADGVSAELGITLASAAQGTGFATDALQAAIHLTFDQTAVSRISAVVDARNLPAIRLLERVGMRRVESVAAVFREQSCVEHIYALRRESLRHSP